MPTLTYADLLTGGEFVEFSNSETLTLTSQVTEAPNGSVPSGTTRDVDRAVAAASRLETGTDELNGSSSGYYAPMGGLGTSGLGRANGADGPQAHLELKLAELSENAAEYSAGLVDAHTFR